eukprot:CAMPEP_0180170774 /NCGR_PEP_ID=MMETSP0986-20121125/34026_1 /TAXON_ID=697907 /ORGANISM="non described non described, Strain CCMP2293" /LENGTH=41 /DNA_ID= /DNA_START= /DNA_END= /DNA_ORIENTATION=
MTYRQERINRGQLPEPHRPGPPGGVDYANVYPQTRQRLDGA